MRLVYDYLFTVLWIAFFVYWQVMALNVKTTRRLEPAGSRAMRVLMFGAAIVLLSFRFPVAWLNLRLWPQGRVPFWVGFAITLAGLFICVWARVHLGRNWSRSVTIKQDHELVVTGPYALVRHPIYTGILTGFIGTGLAVGELRAVLAFALFAISLWYKLRLEEKWMRAQFGARYEEYSGRVAAVVPYVL
ncbi:MAG TPA: isoprenylcysteine carboxylmethyltransferase family protein [Terracidiphilus sp.]|nr:isoprenylcysteine carboxylmethyltransferase family protein [Terracidiphilus sp.]